MLSGLEGTLAKDGFDLNKEFDPNIFDPFQALIRGQTIGKKAVVPLIGGGVQDVISAVTLLNIQSTDFYARQLCLTLQSPRFIANDVVTALITAGNVQGLSGEYDNQVNGFPNFVIGNPSAIIEWGIGGTNDRVEVDFSNGLCVNFQASFLRVTCKMDTLGITEETDDVAYVLSAFIGPGNAKASNAQRSVSCGSFTDVGFSNLFAVPKYAKSVTLEGVQAIGTVPGMTERFSGTIQFFRANAVSTDSMISESFFDESTHYPVNVPNGAIFFRVQNLTTTHATSLTRVTAIFDLSI